MSTPEKPGQTVPLENDGAESGQQTPDPGSPICYRMEPAKRMLSGAGVEEHA
jgi:hypothetical protein